MPNPAYAPRTTMGNVQWRMDGTATASFVTPTSNLRHLPPGLRTGDLFRWAGAYATLPGPYIHQSITRQVPVSAVMQRMAASVPGGPDNLADYPHWQQKMVDTADFLATGLPKPPVEKWCLLTVDLGLPRPNASTVAMWTARAMVTGLMPPPPNEKEQQSARRAADALHRRLRTLVPGIIPATEGELRWFASCARSFGGIEPPYTHPRFQSNTGRTTALVPLGDAVMNNVRPRPTKHLTIETAIVRDPYPGDLHTADETQTVHQAFLVVTDFAGEWAYPDAALWNDLDDLPYPHRAALIGQPIQNAAARKSLNGIYKHLAWTDEESEYDTTPHLDASIARRDLDDELRELISHGGPALPTTIVIGLGATDVDELNEQVAGVKAILDPTQTYLAQPRGRQSDLWAAMLPGGSQPYVVRSYALELHTRDAAGLGLYHSSDLGDNRGRLYALAGTRNEDAPPRLIHRDPTFGPRDTDGNNGATRGNVGDLGSGKSLDVKEDAHDVWCLGGGVYAFDRSKDREISRAALASPVPVMVVDPANPHTTIDPLRVFTSNLPDDPERRADMLQLAEKHTLGYLAIKTSIRTDDDPRYDVLTTAVHQLLAPNPPLLPSLPNLLTLLRYKAGDDDLPPAPTRADGTPDTRFNTLTVDLHREAAATVAMRLTNIEQSGMTGANLFGDGTPLDLAQPGIIFSAPGLTFDSADARAVLYLATAYGLAFLVATDRFNLIVLTELAALAADPWGQVLIDDALRQSRRAYGGMASDAQLARDYKEPELLVVRTAARTKDADAAAAALRFVGMEPTAQDIADLISAPTGLKVYRDQKGRIGWADVLPPLNTARYNLFRTDPGRPETKQKEGAA